MNVKLFTNRKLKCRILKYSYYKQKGSVMLMEKINNIEVYVSTLFSIGTS